MKYVSLSVCVPLYKPRFDHLKSLLESIASIPNSIKTEALFSFDGGTEIENKKIVELIKSFKEIESVIIFNNQRLGMVGNWNETIKASKNTFVLLVGQDDVVVGNNVNFFLENINSANQDAIFGIENYISDTGKIIEDPRKSLKPDAYPMDEIKTFPSGVVTTIGLVYGNIIADPCGAIIRRTVFDFAGYFSENFAHSADLEFWLRLDNLKLTMGRLPIVLSLRRIHPENATNSHVSSGLANANRLDLFEKYAIQETNFQFNRALTRLWTHWAHDTIRVRKLLSRPKARYRGNVMEVSNAVASEVLETLRLKSPTTQFRRLIAK
jgi:GT2 family glycosyltransferase